MFALVTPDPNRYEAWAAAFHEYGTTAKDGTGFRAEDVVDTSPAGFEAYLADRARQADVSQPAPEGRVHCDYYWMLDDDELVGFIAVRHCLNDFLLFVGGHIGYSVLPSKRRRGYATQALKLALERAHELAIDPVMVSCLVDNDASRGVIERCGGEFDDIRNNTRRYWFGSKPWPTQTTCELGQSATP